MLIKHYLRFIIISFDFYIYLFQQLKSIDSIHFLKNKIYTTICIEETMKYFIVIFVLNFLIVANIKCMSILSPVKKKIQLGPISNKIKGNFYNSKYNRDNFFQDCEFISKKIFFKSRL